MCACVIKQHSQEQKTEDIERDREIILGVINNVYSVAETI